MGSNEEYLDNLLKSMNHGESENKEMTPEEIEAMFAAIEEPETKPAPEPIPAENPAEVIRDLEEDLESEDVSGLEEDGDMIPEPDEDTGGTVMPEDAADMTQEDIERLLEQAVAESEKLETASEPESSDELDEINELLRKADNNEAVDEDMLALLEGIEEPATALTEQDEEMPAQEEKRDRKRRKEKKEKKEKRGKRKQPDEPFSDEIAETESVPETGIDIDTGIDTDVDIDIDARLAQETEAESTQPDAAVEKKEKRKGKLAGFFAFLTEEDEEETVKKTSGELASNSEENETILKELEEEDKAQKKGKKKGKKGKKAEPEEAADEEEEGSAKKKSSKKAPKPKKEKKEKGAAPAGSGRELSGKKISGKKVCFISLICLTVMAIIFILCTFLSQTADVRTAKKAFYQGEYVQCYQLLYGKELNENETLIFKKAEVLSGMQRRWDAYTNYSLMGKELEALDSLVQAPKTYDKLQEHAAALNIVNDFNAIYEKIMNELNEEYRISEEQARELGGCEEPAEYTEQLRGIIEETESRDTQSSTQAVPEPMEDILPQEEELDEFNFIQ